MGGWGDDTSVQGKAQLRPLSTLSTVRVQNSAQRTGASRLTCNQVPKVWRYLQRDGQKETAGHVLRGSPKVQRGSRLAALRRAGLTVETSSIPTSGMPRYHLSRCSAKSLFFERHPQFDFTRVRTRHDSSAEGSENAPTDNGQ
jgi:hypothetical protein